MELVLSAGLMTKHTDPISPNSRATVGRGRGFLKATGRYPDRLGALVPTYLDSAALRTPLEYSKIEPSGYELSFRYTGPGSNRCAVRASASKWSCSGLY